MNTSLQVHHINGSPVLMEQGKPTQVLCPDAHEAVFSSDSLEECVLVSHLTQEVRSVIAKVKNADGVADLLTETVDAAMRKRYASAEAENVPEVVSDPAEPESEPVKQEVSEPIEEPTERPAIKD